MEIKLAIRSLDINRTSFVLEKKKKKSPLQPKYEATRCVKETILSVHQNNSADAMLADGLSRLNYCINI